ncbi:IS3 family transposase [Acinetobacter sp. 1125_18A]
MLFQTLDEMSSYLGSNAKIFFQLLKRKHIKKKNYVWRSDVRTEIFEYIKIFYNSKCRHDSN